LRSADPAGSLVGGKILFLPLGALYPECGILRGGHPLIRPLACLEDAGCHLGVSATCMATLARRVGRLFDAHPALEVVLLYWALPTGELRGTRFDRAFSPPRVSRLRRASLHYYLQIGQRYPVVPELLA
jgi:hypothetical protein